MPKPKVGDVYSIKLPNDRYAFGRVMHDSALQIFKKISDIADQAQIDYKEIWFTVAVYKKVFRDSRIKMIGSRNFETDEDAWPPKTYVYNPISGTYSVYNKGNVLPSTYKECEDLEPTSVWGLDPLIDRITGSNDLLNAIKDIERR